MMFPPINSHFPFRLISLILSGHTKKNLNNDTDINEHIKNLPGYLFLQLRLVFFRRLESLSNIMHIVNGKLQVPFETENWSQN